MPKSTRAARTGAAPADRSRNAVDVTSALAEAESPAIFRMDLDGTILSWNAGSVRLFGHGSAAAVGASCAAMLCAGGDKQSDEALRGAVDAVRGTGKVQTITVKTGGSGLSRGWAVISLVPLLDNRRVPAGIAGVAHDLTAERESRERMVRSGERYRTLLQLLPDIVYVLSPAGEFVFVSDSVRGLGYSPEELFGKHFKHLIHPDDYPIVSREHVLPRFAGTVTGETNAPKLFDERRSGRRKTTNLEVRLVPKEHPDPNDGRVAIVSAVNASGHYTSLDANKDENRLFLGTIGVIRDITERKRTEEERRKLEAQLHQARKMEAIGQLAGGIAHDFNNMLSGISGYAEVIKRRNRRRNGTVRDETLAGHIDVVIRAAERAADLTTKLLAFSRQGKYEIVPIDLHGTIHDAIGLLRHTIDRRIEIRQRLSAKRSVIQGDRAQIENAVLNLAMNACDAMPEGGTLSFRTRVVELDETDVRALPYRMAPGAYILLTVADTGAGMDSDTCERIFEPFFTTKADGKGTGLGLASVYGTIKSHHGSIEARSRRRAGSVFCIHLPLCTEQQRPVSKNERGEPGKGSGLVLIVDDEEIVRDILARMLRELGYLVEQSCNGSEALDTYRRLGGTVDLVVLDMNMPVMSGLDCLRELKKLDPRIRVIMTTGYTHAAVMRDSRDMGALGVIVKPFRFAPLAEQISKALKA